MYPYVPYIQYLLPGSIVMSIFMMVMIGGGIIFIDDKARGLHEGYLVTPITRLELILGFTSLGRDQGRASRALVLMTLGSVDRRRAEPVRAAAAGAAVRRHRGHVDRARQHDVPAHGAHERPARAARDVRRAQHVAVFSERRRLSAAGVSRAGCARIAKIDPFTYAVHALKSLVLKNTGFGAIGYDLLYLAIFSVVAMTLATQLFRRTL